MNIITTTEEDFLSEEDRLTPPLLITSPTWTHKACIAAIDKVCPDSPLPDECQQYEDVKMALHRRNSNRASHAIAFQGMSAGEATAAMVAREHGRLHHAQIQRRLTSPSNVDKPWW